MRAIANALRGNGADVTYLEIHSDAGHDAFLLETAGITRAIRPFLRCAHTELRRRREVSL
jgi:homoserine acetyltransferase